MLECELYRSFGPKSFWGNTPCSKFTHARRLLGNTFARFYAYASGFTPAGVFSSRNGGALLAFSPAPPSEKGARGHRKLPVYHARRGNGLEPPFFSDSATNHNLRQNRRHDEAIKGLGTCKHRKTHGKIFPLHPLPYRPEKGGSTSTRLLCFFGIFVNHSLRSLLEAKAFLRDPPPAEPVRNSQDLCFNLWLAQPLEGAVTGLAPKRGAEFYCRITATRKRVKFKRFLLPQTWEPACIC